MKVSWRLGAEQQPSEDIEVVGKYPHGNEFVKFENPYWVDRFDSLVDEPIWWMYLPLPPDE
jgi:hypothetical protein